MIRLYLGKIVSKFLIIFERLAEGFILNLQLARTRNEAHRLRKEVVKKKGETIVKRHIKKTIKEYTKERFGKTAYWPYLALYTEIRGQFINGWVPYDYYEYIFMPKVNPKACGYLSDQKTFDYNLFGEFAIKPLFVFISGMLFNSDLDVVDRILVRNLLSDYNDIIVVKEESGMGGKQVNIVHSSEFLPEKLKNNKNYIIQPYVRQYKVLEDLYPESVNTFRVTTFLRTDSYVDIKLVVLRFGIDGTKVDNLSSGGQYLYFDFSGRPSDLAYDYELGFEIGDRHKNTGFLFSDVRIPMFNEMLEKCKNAHKKYPYVRLIGWDVCIDSSGVPKLIEWNAFNPVFWPMEARFGPLWKDIHEI